MTSGVPRPRHLMGTDAAGLDPSGLNWIGVRFLDPIGRVFEHDGEVYRAIYPHSVGHVESLLHDGVVDTLVERQLLVPTEISDLEVKGYGMVLRHERAPFPTRPALWPRSLIRDAARLIVNLNLELARFGLGTIDFHPGNIKQMGGSRPVWIDLGSIQPLPSERTFGWRGHAAEARRVLRAIRGRASEGVLKEEVMDRLYLQRRGMTAVPEEFRQSFLHPLTLLSQDAAWSRVVRLLMEGGGIADREARRMTRRRSTRVRARQSWLGESKRWLDDLTFPSLKTYWGTYSTVDSFNEGPSSDARTETARQIVREVRPRRAIDLGCNAGAFSAMVADESPGCQIYSVDSDEEAVERLYAGVRRRGDAVSVTTALGDVLSLGDDREPVRGDFVMALALSHHLFFRQGCRFPVIAKLFASFTTDVLLSEFMPNGLGMYRPNPDPLPAHYTLEEFVSALEAHFQRVEIIRWQVPNGHSPRIFLLARGKR